MRESDVIEYGLRRALVTGAVILATVLDIVDVTIINVALPNVQGNVGVAVDQSIWIVTGYIIANVIVIPISPWLATAVLITILTRSDAVPQTALAAGVAHHVHAVQAFLSGAGSSGSGLQQLYSMVVGQALVLSCADTARVTAIISTCLAPLVLLLRPPRTHAAPFLVE